MPLIKDFNFVAESSLSFKKKAHVAMLIVETHNSYPFLSLKLRNRPDVKESDLS